MWQSGGRIPELQVGQASVQLIFPHQLLMATDGQQPALIEYGYAVGIANRRQSVSNY
jgi:hypothetical protein